MAQEICGKTKVTVNGNEYLCDNFPNVWEVLEQNNYAISKENKTNLIRILFVCGAYLYDDNLKFEVVWED